MNGLLPVCRPIGSLFSLLFPDEFERIFSFGERKLVLEHFAKLPKLKFNKLTAPEIDKLLREARRRLESEYGTTDLDFYCPPLRVFKFHDGCLRN
jgi:5-methylcytosine-specific restriction protein B